MGRVYSENGIQRHAVDHLIKHDDTSVTLEFTSGAVFKTQQPQDLDYQMDISIHSITIVILHDGDHESIYDRQGSKFYLVP